MHADADDAAGPPGRRAAEGRGALRRARRRRAADTARMTLPAAPALRVLTLCGSLRRASLNAMLLRVAARLAPADVAVAPFAAIGELPLFNPDLEADPPPAAAALHAAVARADALLVATPEYAHGVSGTIKNALDWLVGLEAFVHVPVAVINASPRAHHADAALRETLRTMSAGLVGEASFALPLLGAHLDEAGMAASPAVRETVARAFAALREAAARRRGGAGEAPSAPLP
jgi:NAD(P)H-dependent FMN reductase